MKLIYGGLLFTPIVAGVMLLIILLDASAQTTASIQGIVVDAQGPIAGAAVRQRATDTKTTTANDGTFTLSPVTTGTEIEVTAWQDGYYINSVHVTPPTGTITITLRPYHQTDNPNYAWTSPIPGSSPGACGNCHPMIIDQWQNNAHGTAVSNARFFSLYNGTNLSGTVHIGDGFQNDFPNTAGTCANCHAPGAAIDGYLTTNMNDHRDVLTSGIHCDYCHKTGDVYLDPATQSVYPNMPGAQSQRMLRPPDGDNIFFGPYDDIKDPDTFLPLISESQYCAACHQFSFWGTPIYESYEEWLASPYAEAGVTCQDCHMPPNGDTFFASPEVGGLEHPPETIPSHVQLGAQDEPFLQDSVAMSVEVSQRLNRIEVSVTITNTGAGHHIPTDFPGRQLILLVHAADDGNQSLTQMDGPTIPTWGGNEAGNPGEIFAKLLRDVDSGDFPVVSYWKQTIIEKDNRIPALASEKVNFLFVLPDDSRTINISGSLWLRRVPTAVAEEKEWLTPDILLATSDLIVNTDSVYDHYLPVMFSSNPP